MLKTPQALRGMVTTPHHLASQTGLAELRAGGSAVEAVVAAAATLSVVYPHMTGLGGDGFWLVAAPGREPLVIAAAGPTGANVDAALYRRNGLSAVPVRGPLAANTVAGAVEGWRAALSLGVGWENTASLSRLFADAIEYAETGAFVSGSQAELTRDGLPELREVPGFAATFLDAGRPPAQGTRRTNPALARTYRRLATAGLDDFYQGSLAADIGADLARVGSPITLADLRDYRSTRTTPLSIRCAGAQIYNTPPPTQGVTSLMIIALFDRLGITSAEGFEHIHGIVEATKLAMADRNLHLGDPARMSIDVSALLNSAYLDRLAGRINPVRSHARELEPAGGDTVWLAAIDGEGRSASYIQSIYYDFGSGVVLPETGILWQNRGTSFELDGEGPRAIRPRTLPFHTLNPAMARFDDGRTMVFGAMGGDGQPQTHAAIFSRYAMFGQELQEAVAAPRWLLGRRWADEGHSLKLEDRFDSNVVDSLREAGHEIEVVAPYSDLMGHAGAIVRQRDGGLEGATDPRSDGAVAGW